MALRILGHNIRKNCLNLRVTNGIVANLHINDFLSSPFRAIPPCCKMRVTGWAEEERILLVIGLVG